MSKLPVISGRDIVRVLTKIGFAIVGRKGSHIRLKSRRAEEVLIVIVPMRRELAKNIAESNPELKFYPFLPGDIPRSVADIPRARNELKFAVKTPVDRGFSTTVQWLEKTFEQNGWTEAELSIVHERIIGIISALQLRGARMQ